MTAEMPDGATQLSSLPSRLRSDEDMPTGFDTPWGPAQDSKRIGRGLWWVSTAGHGGYYVSPEQWEKIGKRFPKFRPFGDNIGWLEEDCDSAIAPIVWPEHFSAERTAEAADFIRNMARTLGPDCGGPRWQAIALTLPKKGTT